MAAGAEKVNVLRICAAGYFQQRAEWLAGELGFEPRLAESESAVLPLDDSPTYKAMRHLAVPQGSEAYNKKPFTINHFALTTCSHQALISLDGPVG